MGKRISQAKADAVAFQAVAASCKRNADREVLDDGGSYDVDLRCKGKVEGVAVSFPIAGLLTVGEDDPTGTSKTPKTVDVLALAISAIPKTRRERWLDGIAKAGTVGADADCLELARLAIGKLTTKGPKRGSVKLTERTV